MNSLFTLSNFRQSKLAVRGLLLGGLALVGLGGIAGSEAGCRYSSSVSDLNHQESRLAKATRDTGGALSDEAETLAGYVETDAARVRRARGDLSLWTVVALAGAAACVAGGMMFMRGARTSKIGIVPA